MTQRETHPEALLELALASTLEHGRRAELEAHCRSCVACAAHLESAELFEREGRSRPGDDAATKAAVEMAMQANDRRLSARSPPARRRVALGAVAVFFGASAAAALWQAAERSSTTESAPPGPPKDDPTGKRSTARAKSPTASAQVLPEAPRAKLPSARASAEALAPATNSITAAATRPASEAAPASATQLYAQAQLARREGKSDRAAELYAALQRRFPASREARASHAWLGRLYLNQGRSAQALRQFDRYLGSGGAASEEALAGRAQALKALGRVSDEREAWRQLLRRFPKSIYADQAQARLGASSR